MEIVGVSPGGLGQACDGLAMDANQSCGGSDAASLAQVGEHVVGLLGREVGAEQGRALALGEAGLAGVAIQQADVVELAVAVADREVAGVALAVAGAVGVLAAEAGKVVHRTDRGRGLRLEAVTQCK
jgi:hypothetical protein